jgi:hypothetical protein
MDEHAHPAPPFPPRAAHDDLAYIRETLDAAGRFSSVPGRGLMVIGVLALAGVAANRLLTGAPWEAGASDVRALGVWVVLLFISLAVGAWAMQEKGRRTGQVVWSPVLRKALWGYSAAMLLGGLLTFTAWRLDELEILPEIWLGCYGTALVAAGVMSVAPVRWMGISFLALAALGALLPPGYGLALLAAGFGGLHVGFGAYVAWKYDG